MKTTIQSSKKEIGNIYGADSAFGYELLSLQESISQWNIFFNSFALHSVCPLIWS